MRKINIQLTISPHNPAWIPSGLTGIASPAQLPIMKNNEIKVPTNIPIKTGLDFKNNL